jgi:nicotinate-nucleotide pyrophosphorylase (carboxylating)
MSLIEAVGRDWIERHVDEALQEDLGDRGDITCTATVKNDIIGKAELIAKDDGVIAGLDWAVVCGERTNPPVKWNFLVKDGSKVSKGEVIAVVEGPITGILISERTALNGFGHLSGVATYAARAMAEVKGTDAQVIDTRKTFPGWRLAQKYAVRMGGAGNHRIGLYDEILIKENHVEAAGGVGEAIQYSKKWRDADLSRAGVPVEVEVETIDELKTALKSGPDRILLDNFSSSMLSEAVKINNGRCLLEASGGITLKNLKEVAETGVNRISLGAITHSVIPLDISLLVRESSTS